MREGEGTVVSHFPQKVKINHMKSEINHRKSGSSSRMKNIPRIMIRPFKDAKGFLDL
jgi:hypothetical protein